MKKFILAVFLLVFLPSCARAAGHAEIGKPAPDFTLPDTRGQDRSLSDFRGKIVVLEWTNHECPYVHKHYDSGNMQALQKQAAAHGAVWLTIVSSAPGEQGFTGPEEANRIIAETGAAATARLLDPEGSAGRLYGAKTTPHMFVIDKNGLLVYAGGIDDAPSTDPATLANAHNYVRQALDDLAAGHPVATPLTRPYGCSVKY